MKLMTPAGGGVGKAAGVRSREGRLFHYSQVSVRIKSELSELEMMQSKNLRTGLEGGNGALEPSQGEKARTGEQAAGTASWKLARRLMNSHRTRTGKAGSARAPDGLQRGRPTD